MAFDRNTRHALHCQLSTPTLLTASQEKSRLTEQCSSRTIWQLHSTILGHQQPLDCVFSANISARIPRWLYNYMQNRRVKVHYRQHEFKSRMVKTGVVQGGVLSPALFNYYLADFPTPPPNIKLIRYADDITIYISGQVVAGLINSLNIYLSLVLSYITNNKLTVLTACSDTFHARYSRTPFTSASEVGRPSTTAWNEEKCVRSDARHPSHFHTTLQQYRSRRAATQ